jgi:hypothetical protein
MPTGELFIKDKNGNWKDAYTNWGLSLTDGALSALMTPPPIKALIESTYRKKAGKVVIMKDVKPADRDLTLPVHFTAKTKADFYSRYSAFCEILQTGKLEIKTSHQPTIVYRFIYVSCQQFSQFVERIAKFVLKLNEPDPTNRGETDANAG